MPATPPIDPGFRELFAEKPREAATRAYAALRELNPHLPPPEFIDATAGPSLTWSLDQYPVLQLDIRVRVPKFVSPSPEGGAE